MNTPDFLETEPNPKLVDRRYNGRKMTVWSGRVKIENIEGWGDNPRIELAKRTLQEKVGNRELSQEELYDLMKREPDVRLTLLRDDILNNGLREPLTLSHKGKLLDGNRRFWALKYALETLPQTDQNRQDFDRVEVYVLLDSATENEEQSVLVEENFTQSLKIEWPDVIKARYIVEAYEKGYDETEIAKMYSWSRSKVKDTIKINGLTNEYIVCATSDPDPEDEHGGGWGLSEQEAESEVSKKYQYFNEGQKSFFTPLCEDIDFKMQFFRWLHEGKFSSFPEVRIAYKAWKDPEAKSALMEEEHSAGKSAKAIIDYNQRVVKSTDDVLVRIDRMFNFLDGITAAQFKLIPEASLEKLEKTLEAVHKMAKAAKDTK